MTDRPTPESDQTWRTESSGAGPTHHGEFMHAEPILPIAPEHLPAVVAALRADGVAYLNVGAHWPCDENGCVASPAHPCRCEVVVPPEWRALADAMCVTCEGTGTVQAFDQRHADTCPDCRGTGKPIHTLTAPCPACTVEQGGRIRPGMELCTRCKPGHWEFCDCTDLDEGWPTSEGGLVSVDVVVAELVPVYDNDNTPTLDTTLIEWFDDVDPVLWTAGAKPHDITPLGPPLEPGDWVARLEVIT